MDACQPNPCTQGGQCEVRYGGAQLNQNNGGHTGAGHYWYPGRTTPDPADQSCKQSGAQVCCRCPNHAYTRDCSAMRKFIECHFTACRRSLRKGNVFTHVSVSAIRSVHRGVSLPILWDPLPQCPTPDLFKRVHLGDTPDPALPDLLIAVHCAYN